MRTLYTLAFLSGLISVAQAQIVEKPLKLEGQADNDKNNGAIVFPPATEPYQAMGSQPAAGQPQAYQQPVAQPAYQQPMAQPSNQPQPVQPAYNTAPQPSYSGGAFASRETLERAAESCEAELGQLWQQKTNMDPSRRGQFQKCIGEAKVRCDQLREAAKAFKNADYSLYNYQNKLQEARNSLY